MRVLLAADFYPPQPGGLEAHVARLADHLILRGHQVEIVAGPGPQGRSVPNVTRSQLALAKLPRLYQNPEVAFHPPWPDSGFVATLEDVARRIRPDVIHAHGWCEFSAAVVADRLSIPLVVTLHDYGLLCPKKTLLRGGGVCDSGRGASCLTCRPAEGQSAPKRAALSLATAVRTRSLVRTVTRFAAVSSYVADRHAMAGVPGEKLETIPNFLDRPPLAATIASPPTHHDYVLFVGPEALHKGREVLLAAHAMNRAPNRRLVLVGGSGTTSARLADHVEDWGRLQGDPLWDAYRSAALVVVPSIWAEPCPTVALEAMALGKPIVASDIGGLRDLVAPGETGLLVPPGDPSALAEAIDEVMADADLRTRMAQAARARSAMYSPDVVIPMVERAYQSAMDARRPGGSR